MLAIDLPPLSSTLSFLATVKNNLGPFNIFPLPAGTMLNLFSRGRWRDTAEECFLLAGSLQCPQSPSNFPAASPITPCSVSSPPPCKPWLCPLPWRVDLSLGGSHRVPHLSPGGSGSSLYPGPTFFKLSFLYFCLANPFYFNPCYSQQFFILNFPCSHCCMVSLSWLIKESLN